MHALAARKAKVNAVGAIGLVENMPDGKAQRPGDIVKTMSGQTIEIINTDAEGRLVLADVLHYVNKRVQAEVHDRSRDAHRRYHRRAGQEYAGMFSNDDKLVGAPEQGRRGDRRTSVADAARARIRQDDRFQIRRHEESGGRAAASITAAQLLQRFVGKTPWAHLDIAGTALGSPQTDINKSWASGWGVRLLDQLVEDHYERSRAAA